MPARKPTILWADDDPFYIGNRVQALVLEGFDVVLVQDAATAMRAFDDRAGKIDLAILDVSMPSGGAFAQANPLAALVKRHGPFDSLDAAHPI